MLFNSVQYIIFFPIVFLIYWKIIPKKRWIIVLASSCFFYMVWNPLYIFLIIGVAGIAYFAGLLCESGKSGRIGFSVSIFCLCGILFLYKYTGFFVENLNQILSYFSLSQIGWRIPYLLPVGISFYTFQSISYIIDVYQGRVKAEKNYGKFLSFIIFFPQLVAGPIERTEHLMPQIATGGAELPVYSELAEGARKMAWGYFKKIVVADTLARYVDMVYGNINGYQGGAIGLAVLFFSIQIYCDFSGYSDIAMGTAKMLGIRLMKNFDAPYFSLTLKEFWRRWHISLSAWFRDYVYIPLGGKYKAGRNLVFTFLLSGLWHGPSWTFIFWGGLHGLTLLLEKKVKDNIWLYQSILGRILSRMIVFMFVTLAWIFFRAETFQDAFLVLMHMWRGIKKPLQYIREGYTALGISSKNMLIISLLILILFLYDYIEYTQKKILPELPSFIRWGMYYALIFIILIFGQFGHSQFIYFQF